MTSSPWPVTFSCQHMAYEPSKVGQTDPVYGLWSEFADSVFWCWWWCW